MHIHQSQDLVLFIVCHFWLHSLYFIDEVHTARTYAIANKKNLVHDRYQIHRIRKFKISFKTDWYHLDSEKIAKGIWLNDHVMNDHVMEKLMRRWIKIILHRNYERGTLVRISKLGTFLPSKV